MGQPEEIAPGGPGLPVPPDCQDDAPPPYTPHAGPSTKRPPESVTGTTAPIRMSVLATPYHRFPPVINAYIQWKITRTYHLGDSSNHKLFAVAHFAGLTGKGPGKNYAVLYNGPTSDDPALAIASEVGEVASLDPFSVTTEITLPPLDPALAPGLEAGPSTRRDDGKKADAVIEIMDTLKPKGLGAATFRFSIEVGQGEPSCLQREWFEWRRQDAIDLGGFKQSYELVRLDASKTDTSLKSHEAAHTIPEGPKGQPSDSGLAEAETGIVAIVRWKSTMAMNKPFSFSFQGQGLTGQLGSRWEVMALATALRLWFVGIQHRL